MSRGVGYAKIAIMQEILLKTFDSLAIAGLAKNTLEKYGIKSILQKRGLEMAEGAGGDMAGADLFVLEKDIEKAKKILEELE